VLPLARFLRLPGGLNALAALCAETEQFVERKDGQAASFWEC